MTAHGSIRERWNRVGLAAGQRTDARATSPAADAGPAPRTPGRSEASGGTFVGSGAVFEGTLSLQGDFCIDTEFRGELETDGKITVGPQGSVVGRIRAREVVIQGAVVGDVTAPRQLIVEATGKLHGDIETACLEIQKYAFFRGRTTMTQPQAIERLLSAADANADRPDERTDRPRGSAARLASAEPVMA